MSEATVGAHSESGEQAWRRQRTLQRRVPAGDGWRGCVGLSAIITDESQMAAVGRYVFVPNSVVKWSAVRDMPPRDSERGDDIVNVVNLATAELDGGKPTLNFRGTHNGHVSWNLCATPDGQTPCSLDYTEPGDLRVLKVSTLQSAWMTKNAFRNRKPWRDRKPVTAGSARKVSPAKWMPRARLEFECEREELFWRTAEQQTPPRLSCCQACNHESEITAFLDLKMDASAAYFEADCPRCSKRGRHYLDDIRLGSTSRFTTEFKKRFVRAVAVGLPANLPCDARYIGLSPENQSQSTSEINLLKHSFVDLTGEQFDMVLPAHAKILIPAGKVQDAGTMVCKLVEFKPSDVWLDRPGRSQWNNLADVLGPLRWQSYYAQTWFRNQAVMLPGNRFLFPADLVAGTPAVEFSSGFWWDVSNAGTYLDVETAAFVFPPIPQFHVDDLELTLPGAIAADFRVNVPRSAFVRPQPAAKSRTSLRRERFGDHLTEPLVREPIVLKEAEKPEPPLEPEAGPGLLGWAMAKIKRFYQSE